MSYNCNGIRKSITKWYLILFCMTTALFWLASCSAGKGTSTSITLTDGSKQTHSVSGATKVPQSMTGQAPQMEIINGITVPPEPNPTLNNATLTGVDVNNNGVRDDVERFIAKESQSQLSFDNRLVIAKNYQKIVTDKMLSSEAVGNLIRQINCKVLLSSGGVESSGIAKLTANNEIRLAAAQKATVDAPGGVINTKSDCQ